MSPTNKLCCLSNCLCAPRQPRLAFHTPPRTPGKAVWCGSNGHRRVVSCSKTESTSNHSQSHSRKKKADVLTSTPTVEIMEGTTGSVATSYSHQSLCDTPLQAQKLQHAPESSKPVISTRAILPCNHTNHIVGSIPPDFGKDTCKRGIQCQFCQPATEVDCH